MTEIERTKLDDPELRERFIDIMQVGKRIFSESALLDPEKQIRSTDLIKVGEFLGECSPQRSGWRLENKFDKEKIEQRKNERKYTDWSTFGNWSEPGGPLESFELASEAGAIILGLINDNPPDIDSEEWVLNARKKLDKVDPNLLRVAGLLHDSGRLLTHLFLTNEKIGNLLLKKIGIRDDIISILPDEKIMLASPYTSMDKVIQQTDPSAVILRIADEFGKRYPGSNRLYNPGDYDAFNREQWAANYVNKPPTGRASDRVMRSKMPLHVQNVPRYFSALDTWVRQVSTIDGLDEIADTLNTELSPVLAPLPKN